MNKNTIIYAAIVISMAMVGFIVFSGQQDFETQYTSLKASGELSKTVTPTKEVEVKYQTTGKSAEQKTKELPKREKFVETKAIDQSNKFEISIINDQTWSESQVAASVVRVNGKIDNSPFILKVPSYLVSSKSDVKLKVKNLETGKEDIVPAPFVPTLGLGASGISTSININSSDVSNYTTGQQQSILPNPSDAPPSIPNN